MRKNIVLTEKKQAEKYGLQANFLETVPWNPSPREPVSFLNLNMQSLYVLDYRIVYTNDKETMWKDLIDLKHNTNRPNILAITSGTSNFLQMLYVAN